MTSPSQEPEIWFEDADAGSWQQDGDVGGGGLGGPVEGNRPPRGPAAGHAG